MAVPLFLLIFASVEFGRAMMAMQAMEEAARAGCRIAILDGATDEEVEAVARGVLAVAGITTYELDTVPLSIQQAAQWEPVTIDVTASLNDMSWLPMPTFLRGISYTASCTLPREAASRD